MTTIDLPVIGPTDDKWVYVGGALVAGIAGYSWFTRGRRGTLDAEAGDVAFGEQGEVYDAYGNLIGQPGGTPGYVPPTIVDSNIDVDGRGPQPTTNAEWARLARDELSAFGASGPAVTAALGRFLARQPLSATDAGLVREAIAVAGYPPEGGPWSVVEAEAPPPALPPSKPGMVTGLRYVGRQGPSHSLIQWEPTPGATQYIVKGYAWGHNVWGPEWPETGTQHLAYIGPGKYTYYVFARNAQGDSPSASHVVFTV